MKKVSTKQNQRHIRVMKKRTQREEKRKIQRAIVAIKMEKIKTAGKRIMKAQKRMMSLAKQA
jgi:hypothetical protein